MQSTMWPAELCFHRGRNSGAQKGIPKFEGAETNLSSKVKFLGKGLIFFYLYDRKFS
jgi:hypothetical protein